MEKTEFLEKRNEFRKKSLKQLLELLLSENLSTRFFAEMALRDISGT